MAPPITSICLRAEWSVGILKSCYLRYEVASDKFCGQELTELDPVTSELSVFCCCFELDEQPNDKFNTYLKYVVAAGYVVSGTMFVIINFLIADVFCHYEFLCDKLHPSSCYIMIPCFMDLPLDLLFVYVLNHT